MAATGGGNGPALSQQLRDQAHQFDFFQAVRVLHWMARRSRPPRTEPRRPLGYDFAPARKSSASARWPRTPFPPGRWWRSARRARTAGPRK